MRHRDSSSTIRRLRPTESRNFQVGYMPGIPRQESCDVTKCGGSIALFTEKMEVLDGAITKNSSLLYLLYCTTGRWEYLVDKYDGGAWQFKSTNSADGVVYGTKGQWTSLPRLLQLFNFISKTSRHRCRKGLQCRPVLPSISENREILFRTLVTGDANPNTDKFVTKDLFQGRIVTIMKVWSSIVMYCCIPKNNQLNTLPPLAIRS